MKQIKNQIKYLQETYNLAPNELEFIDGEIRILNNPLEQWHKELWGWLAENPKHTKQDFVRKEFKDNDGIRELLHKSLSCFACLHDKVIAQAKFETPYCRYCPLAESFAKLGDDSCGRLSFVWGQSRANYLENRAADYAKQIQNLKWKSRIEFENQNS